MLDLLIYVDLRNSVSVICGRGGGEPWGKTRGKVEIAERVDTSARGMTLTSAPTQLPIP
jgi:hypothetical protein